MHTQFGSQMAIIAIFLKHKYVIEFLSNDLQTNLSIVKKPFLEKITVSEMGAAFYNSYFKITLIKKINSPYIRFSLFIIEAILIYLSIIYFIFLYRYKQLRV